MAVDRVRSLVSRFLGRPLPGDPFSLGPEWHYHTLRDREGHRLWEGQYDLYPLWPRFGIPDDLRGQSVLDIGTASGFYAFECEKRGAAEVVATELEDLTQWDTRAGAESRAPNIPRRNQDDFHHAAGVMESQVRLQFLNIGDPVPQGLGPFDWVILGALLTHVEDPIRCLRNVRALTRGRAVIVTTYAPYRPGKELVWLSRGRSQDWWRPTRRLVPEMLRAVGFSRVREVGTFTLRHRKGYRQRQGCWHAAP
jgi:tRNA (mo5U34)-methyltransferase